MKYPIVISYHSITNHIRTNHIIYIDILPQKKEFVLKFQENNNICTTKIYYILEIIITLRVFKIISM